MSSGSLVLYYSEVASCGSRRTNVLVVPIAGLLATLQQVEVARLGDGIPHPSLIQKSFLYDPFR